jgi:hypothetical protein
VAHELKDLKAEGEWRKKFSHKRQKWDQQSEEDLRAVWANGTFCDDGNVPYLPCQLC